MSGEWGRVGLSCAFAVRGGGFRLRGRGRLTGDKKQERVAVEGEVVGSEMCGFSFFGGGREIGIR